MQGFGLGAKVRMIRKTLKSMFSFPRSCVGMLISTLCVEC